MPDDRIKEKYKTVGSSLENAMSKAHRIQIEGEEENVELQLVRTTLKQLNNEFKEEIDKLEKASEWDKFCMAFFGETNAGKSTIVDTLRIIYDEESRHEEIRKQEEEYQKGFDIEIGIYTDLLQSLKKLNAYFETGKRARIVSAVQYIGMIVIGIVIGFIMAWMYL